MKRFLIAGIFALFAAGGFSQTAVFYSIEAPVLLSEGTRAGLITWVESSGGYVTLSSNSYLLLRVPVAEIPNIRPSLAEHSRRVLRYDISSVSLDQQIQSATAAIASREEFIARSREYLATANVEGTLALEQEISAVIREIESYRGTLRLLQNQSNYAELRIPLSAPEPVRPGSGYSSFAWLRDIDFYGFMGGDFE